MRSHRSYLVFSFISLLYFIYGCKKAEDIKVFPDKPEKALADKAATYPYDRLQIVHLYKDTVYTLSGLFIRQAGEQLTIDEGTLIKVDAEGASSGIVINAGGVLIANGTAANPIIFTSASPTGNQYKSWDGIRINGNAPNNSANPNGDIADYSGSLQFLRIEFGNLVLNSVGNRTFIQYIQVSYSYTKSSFDIEGGSFSAKNLISFACGGPADFYITKGFNGKLQNVIASRHPFFGAPGSNPYNALSGLFIENNPDNLNANPITNPTISNLTVIGPNGQNGSTPSYADTTYPFRAGAVITTGNSKFRLRNSLALGFPVAAWYIDDSLTGKNIVAQNAEFTYSIFQSADTNNTFYLYPTAYPPFTSADFKNYIMGDQYHNQLFYSAAQFMFTDPFNYDDINLQPNSNSPVLAGANFDGPDFSDPFFEKTTYMGAIGSNDWTIGWSNFVPLKTNYNFPK